MEQYKYIKQYKYSRKNNGSSSLKTAIVIIPLNTFNTLCLLLFLKHY